MFSVDFSCPKISGVHSHIVLQCRQGNRAKITGIAQLLFLSLAHVCQSRHNDVISHVGSIFGANKFAALVTFGGINSLNASGGEIGQNKLYFPLWSC